MFITILKIYEIKIISLINLYYFKIPRTRKELKSASLIALPHTSLPGPLQQHAQKVLTILMAIKFSLCLARNWLLFSGFYSQRTETHQDLHSMTL